MDGPKEKKNYFGDFNAHSSEWWIGDDTDYEADDTDYEGRELSYYFSTNQLHQHVTEPTFFVGDNKSCRVLVLTDQSNLVMNCEIIPSLHTSCHQQLNHVILNIRCPPLPPFSRRIWHYDRA